jgi:hypothetical protein
MKTTKLVIGIFSMVFFIFIILQSCATGVANALSGDTEDSSGTAGVFVALFMLIAAIIGVITRKEVKGGYYAGAFYLLAAIIGFSSLGTFTDLVVWSSISLIFALVFILSGVFKKKSNDLATDTVTIKTETVDSSNASKKLTDLKKLLDDGIINVEEYAKQKAKILDNY